MDSTVKGNTLCDGEDHGNCDSHKNTLQHDSDSVTECQTFGTIADIIDHPEDPDIQIVTEEEWFTPEDPQD